MKYADKFDELWDRRIAKHKELSERLRIGNILEGLDEYKEINFGMEIEQIDNCIYIQCSDCCTLSNKLVLEEVQIDGRLDDGFNDVQYFRFYDDHNGYHMELCSLHLDESNEDEYCQVESVVNIDFKSARTEVKIVNAMETIFYGNQWNYLAGVAKEIAKRIHYVKWMLNPKESELMSLVSFLGALEEEDLYKKGANEFIEMAEAVGASDVSKRISRYIKSGFNYDKLKEKCNFYITTGLNHIKYEPLWRCIYSKFKESQMGISYPWEENGIEKLKLIREDIDFIMKRNGFDGQYPEYQKESMHYIKYIEDCSCGVIIQAVVGTIFKKDYWHQEESDVFSTMFYDGKKRKSRTMRLEFYQEEYPPKGSAPDACDYAKIVVKRATFEKLTKEEKKNPFYNESGASPASVLEIVCMLLFMTVFFGFFMMVGFMAIEAVITLIFLRSFTAVFQIMSETPWWLIFLSTGGMFAVIMVVLQLTTKKY